MRIALYMCLFAGPVWAQTCPPVPDHTDRLSLLFGEIQLAPDQGSARMLSQGLWELWTDAPDEIAQELLDRGMERMRYGDHLGARDALDRLVRYCPDFAEGYNQRAFSHYLQLQFNEALTDLDIALRLNPEHLGALTGRALTLIGLGRENEAQIDLRTAVQLNPWLSERALLKEPPGEDI